MKAYCCATSLIVFFILTGTLSAASIDFKTPPFSGPASQYNTPGTAAIEVNDTTANLDTGLIETVPVQVVNMMSGETESGYAQEINPVAGIFRISIPISDQPGDSIPFNNKIFALNGHALRTDYYGLFDTVQITAGGGGGPPGGPPPMMNYYQDTNYFMTAFSYNSPGTAYIQVTDSAGNKTGGVDTISLTVKNMAGLDTEYVTATQISASDSRFRATLTISNDTSDLYPNGKLYAVNGQTVMLYYETYSIGTTIGSSAPNSYAPPTDTGRYSTYIPGVLGVDSSSFKMGMANVDTFLLDFKMKTPNCTWSLKLDFKDTGNFAEVKEIPAGVMATTLITKFGGNSYSYGKDFAFEIVITDSNSVELDADDWKNNVGESPTLSFTYVNTNINPNRFGLFWLDESDSTWYDIKDPVKGITTASYVFTAETVSIKVNHFTHFFPGEVDTDMVTCTLAEIIPSRSVSAGSTKVTVLSVNVLADTWLGDTLTFFEILNNGNMDTPDVDTVSLWHSSDGDSLWSAADTLVCNLSPGTMKDWKNSNFAYKWNFTGTPIKLIVTIDIKAAAGIGDTFQAYMIAGAFIASTDEDTGPQSDVTNPGIITVAAGGGSATVSFHSEMTYFLSADTYSPPTLAYIKVVDTAANTNAGVRETVSVVVVNLNVSDTENLVLWEANNNSPNFQDSITISTTAADSALYNGKIYGANGNIIRAVYQGAASDTVLIVVTAGGGSATVDFKMSGYFGPAGSYTSSETAYIEVVDTDANDSAALAETVSVVVIGMGAIQDTENVIATESGVNSGIFRISLPISNNVSDSGVNSGTLYAVGGYNIKAIYGAANDIVSITGGGGGPPPGPSPMMNFYADTSYTATSYSYNSPGTAYIQVTDSAGNKTGGVDTISLKVLNNTNMGLDTEFVTATEAGASDSRFRVMVTISNTPADSTSNSGKLYAVNGQTVMVYYDTYAQMGFTIGSVTPNSYVPSSETGFYNTFVPGVLGVDSSSFKMGMANVDTFIMDFKMMDPNNTWTLKLDFLDTGNFAEVLTIPPAKMATTFDTNFKGNSYWYGMSYAFEIVVTDSNGAVLGANAWNTNVGESPTLEFTYANTNLNPNRFGLFYLDETDSIWYDIKDPVNGITNDNYVFTAETVSIKVNHFTHYFPGEVDTDMVTCTLAEIIPSRSVSAGSTKVTVLSVNVLADTWNGDTLTFFEILNNGSMDTPDVDTVSLWHSSDGDSLWSAADTLVCNLTAGTMKDWKNSNFAYKWNFTGTPIKLIVTIDIKAAAGIGDTFQAYMAATFFIASTDEDTGPQSDVTNPGVITAAAAYNGPLWYVDDTGSNNNNGSVAAPFQTITRAMQAVYASAIDTGETIYIGTGTFSETVVIDSSFISIIGVDSAVTIIDGVDSTKALNNCLYADIQSGLVIRNLRVRNGKNGIKFVTVLNSYIENVTATRNNNYGISLETGSNNASVKSCSITLNEWDGFNIDSGSSLIISNNAAIANASSGFYFTDLYNSTLNGNICNNNLAWGFWIITSSNNTITNNTANNNDLEGIYFQTGSNNTISGNTFNGCNSSSGFSLDGCGYTTVENNTSNNNLLAGFNFWSDTNSIVRNNTASNNLDDGYFIASSVNSIFTQNTADSNGSYGFYINLAATRNDTFTKNVIITSPTRPDSAVFNNTFNRFDFTRNWWGTADSSAIDLKIKGKGADSITYTPYRLGIVDTTAGADTIAPQSPAAVYLDTQPGRVNVRWDTSSSNEEGVPGANGLSGFRVYRSVTANSYGSLIGSTAASDTDYIDTAVTGGVTYYYRITAFDAAIKNEGWFSAVSSIRADTLYGDLNGNGVVDNTDLNLMRAVMNQPASALPAADCDGNGRINVTDLSMLIGRWGQ